MIAQRGELLEISYQDNDPGQTCRFLLVPKFIVYDELMQIVLTFKEG